MSSPAIGLPSLGLPSLGLPSLGRPRVHLRSTDSTNDRARELAMAGAPHGTLVTAAEQTAGRGRQGRRWSAPAGSSLLMSLLLRTSPPGCVPPTTGSAGGGADRSLLLLPLIAAVAVCDVAGEKARIKWPNDVVTVQPKGLAKLAGILTEGRLQQGWAVLGIGLNVAVRLEDLPTELRSKAATLGEPSEEIEPTLERLLRALEQRLLEPARGDAHRVALTRCAAWTEHRLGRRARSGDGDRRDRATGRRPRRRWSCDPRSGGGSPGRRWPSALNAAMNDRP